MTRLLNGQILFGFALAALNTVYASQLLQMDAPFAKGQPGPAFLPMILCAFIYFGVARVLIGEFRAGDAAVGAAGDAAGAPAEGSDAIPHIRIVGPLVAIGLTALFIAGFFYVGYAVSAAVYTFLIAFFFNYEQSGALKRSALVALVVAAAVTLFGWLFFVKLFDLYLPIWEF